MFSLMQASSFGTRKRSLIIVTLGLGAVLTACGGGTSRKKTAGGDAPAFSDCVTTAKTTAATEIQNGDVVDGAQLYDRWYAVVGAPAPTADQALWATRADTSVTKSAEDTWRCKTCHGWDYAGKDGAYKVGSSSYTGFPGVLNAKALNATTPENIFCAIKVGTTTSGAAHAFGEQLGDDAHAWNLTKFIVDANGAINTSQYIAANKGIFNANLTSGSDAYKGSGCGTPGACHGADGSLNADDGMGALALDNPWEVLHKVRFGDADSNGVMQAYESPTLLTIAQIADIIAWAQGVPPNGLAGGTGTIVPSGTPGGGASGGGGSSGGANPTASGKVLGALLYDNIAKTLNKTLTGGNPLWDALKASPTPTTDGGTWRCKNCHGWDYKGVEGVNAGGFAAAGGPANLLTAQAKDAAQLKAVIKTGYVNNTATGAQTFHAFGRDAATGAGLKNGVTAVGPGLSDVEIDAIVDFIKNGMIETSTYIGSRGGAFGDPAVGATLFASAATTKSDNRSCSNSACHGADGKAKDFDDGNPATTTPPNEFVGTIAVDNPWEFFHKARWGQPGSQPQMNGTVDAGIPDAQVANLLRFAQDLPTQ